MEQIKPEHPELFALEFGKIAETHFGYTVASPNVNQSTPNLVKMYVTIRSWMSSIMDLIGAELSELFALEFAKIAESDIVYILASTNIKPLEPSLVLVKPTKAWIMWAVAVIWLKYCLKRRKTPFNQSINKYKPMSTKHGHNIYDNEILDEFNYGSNPTVTSRDICPWIRKNCLIWLCLPSSIYK